MSLYEVKHQGGAQRWIQRAVQRDRIPHAYIFHGPDGVGKEMLARGFAQLMICSDPIEQTYGGLDADTLGIDSLRMGCGKCEDCLGIANQNHPDWHLIYRQLVREHPEEKVRKRKGLDIGVDVLRHFVIDRVGHTPVRGKSKVFVIREADRMTTQAQNALLKTLEEPPPNTFIILLVAYTDRLLPTTLSRCQVIHFDALPISFIKTKLCEIVPDLPGEQLDWYARSCEGSIGRAVEFVHDQLYELNQRLIQDLSHLSSAQSAVVMTHWNEASKALGASYRKRDPDITDTEAGRTGLQTLCRLAADYYADVIRVAAGDATRVTNIAWQEQLQQKADQISMEHAADTVNRLAQAQRQLNMNANTQLVVDALFHDLAKV